MLNNYSKHIRRYRSQGGTTAPTTDKHLHRKKKKKGEVEETTSKRHTDDQPDRPGKHAHQLAPSSLVSSYPFSLDPDCRFHFLRYCFFHSLLFFFAFFFFPTPYQRTILPLQNTRGPLGPRQTTRSPHRRHAAAAAAAHKKEKNTVRTREYRHSDKGSGRAGRQVAKDRGEGVRSE